MGILDDVGDWIGSTAEWTISAGGKVWTAAVDLENWTVSLADEVWTAIPGELLAPSLGPLAGVLKNKFNDELFMLAGPSGLIVGLGVFPAQFDEAARTIIAGAALIGAIKHRRMNDEEWRMANWTFGGQLPPRGNIRLTNFGTPWDPDRAVTFPAIANQYYINMGSNYRHRSSIKDGALLLHELTHVWQSRNKLIRDVQVLVAGKDLIVSDYEYIHGSQWKDYHLEQQAQIVQDWANGQIDHFTRLPGIGPLSLGSPLFRYIYTNVRRNDNRARSVTGTSIRRLAAPNEPTRTLRLSDINPPAPHRWWVP